MSRGRPAVVTRSGEDGGRTTCVISLTVFWLAAFWLLTFGYSCFFIVFVVVVIFGCFWLLVGEAVKKQEEQHVSLI